MASYVAPTPKEIEDWTGINITATDTSEVVLQPLLRSLRGQAESMVSLRVTRTVFNSSDLGTDQADGLRRSVALLTAAYWLRSPQVRRTTGDHEPLLVEESGDIEVVIQSLINEAYALADMVAGGGDSGKSQDRQYLTSSRSDDMTFSRDITW